MGMGEPLDNYDNVMNSAAIFNDDRGLAIGARKITISTAGVKKGIEKIIEADLRYKLALSLHSPFEEERSRIMPINRIDSLQSVLATLKVYAKKSKRKVIFEYVLLNNVNDTIAHAQKLIELLNDIPAKLNLIHYHQNDKSDYNNSSADNRTKFYNYLKKGNFITVFRTSRGDDIDAACGQLHLSTNKGADQN